MLVHWEDSGDDDMEYSQVSQVPFTQAFNILQVNSKFVAHIASTSTTLKNSSHQSLNSSIDSDDSDQHNNVVELPLLSQELSLEFENSWSESSYTTNSVSPSKPSDTVSQLRVKAWEGRQTRPTI